MSGIPDSLERYKDALGKPTLDLLNQKYAHTALALFDALFSDEHPQIPTDRLHDLLDNHLDDLVDLGYSDGTDLPPERGRNLCRQWVARDWLGRRFADDGTEVYELTHYTHDARRIANDLARDNPLISDSRLSMILDEVQKLAIDVTPDPAKAILMLDDKIADLQAQRQRLVDGDATIAGDDKVLAGLINLLNLVAQLPGDFERVRDEIDRMRRDMLDQFRRDNRPKGEVLNEYLDRSSRLTAETRHGRAFESALTILSDRAQLAALKDNLRTIVAHPATDTLRVDERRELLASEAMLRRGLERAMHQRHKATRSLHEFITSHNSAEERELDQVLRSLDTEIHIWMDTAGPRSYVPMYWMPGRLDTEHLYTQFYNPANDAPLPGVEDVRHHAPEPLSLEQVRRWGGPLPGEVFARMAELIGEHGPMTLADAFGLLPDDLRRPVELVPLLQAVTDTTGLPGDTELEVVATVRPDGTTKQFLVPVIDLEAWQLPGSPEGPDQ